MRCGHAPPRTGRDEGTVAALFPRMELFKLRERGFAPRVAPAADVAGRERRLTGEPGTGVERSAGADGVRVRLVHVAHALGHAVVGRKSVPLRLLTDERHLVFQRVAGVAGRTGAGPD